jgi:hypothetical protein
MKKANCSKQWKKVDLISRVRSNLRRAKKREVVFCQHSSLTAAASRLSVGIKKFISFYFPLTYLPLMIAS